MRERETRKEKKKKCKRSRRSCASLYIYTYMYVYLRLFPSFFYIQLPLHFLLHYSSRRPFLLIFFVFFLSFVFFTGNIFFFYYWNCVSCFEIKEPVSESRNPIIRVITYETSSSSVAACPPLEYKSICKRKKNNK